MSASSDGRADRELELLERFSDLGVNGILFVTSGTGQSEALLGALGRDKIPPIVSFDRWIRGLDGVAIDSRKAMAQAVARLKGLGHEKVAYLRGLAGTETAAERFESFILAMDKAGLAAEERWIFDGDYQPEAGQGCANEILMMSPNDRPSALLAANDVMAILLMQRLQECGWSLPRDMSVVGFDDILGSSWIYPQLATIGQPLSRMVKEAMSLLARRIAERARNNYLEEARLVTVEPEFILRASISIPFKP